MGKMPLATKAGLGPVDIVLEGQPASRKMGTTLPIFRPISLVTKRVDGSICY